MLIKFKPEDIIMEEQPETTSSQVISDVFVPTFEIKYFAQDEENVYGKMYGDQAAFLALNTPGIQFQMINEIPTIGVEYFVDKKFNQPKNVNDVLKLQMRTKIEQEIGDNEDLISDLFKRVTMLERLLVRLSKDLIDNSPETVPTINTMYNEFINSYLSLQESYGEVTSIADLEDPTELFTKLFTRSLNTTKIVKEDYLDKKI